MTSVHEKVFDFSAVEAEPRRRCPENIFRHPHEPVEERRIVRGHLAGDRADALENFERKIAEGNR